MGIKLVRGADFDIRLERIAEKSTRALRRVNKEGAEAFADTAKQMAPYKSGTLEEDIGVIETKEVGNTITRTIGHINPPKYAIYMHEGLYSLGRGSRAKQAASQFTVGRKYIERAAQWLIQDWHFYEKCKAALRKL